MRLRAESELDDVCEAPVTLPVPDVLPFATTTLVTVEVSSAILTFSIL